MWNRAFILYLGAKHQRRPTVAQCLLLLLLLLMLVLYGSLWQATYLFVQFGTMIEDSLSFLHRNVGVHPTFWCVVPPTVQIWTNVCNNNSMTHRQRNISSFLWLLISRRVQWTSMLISAILNKKKFFSYKFCLLITAFGSEHPEPNLFLRFFIYLTHYDQMECIGHECWWSQWCLIFLCC